MMHLPECHCWIWRHRAGSSDSGSQAQPRPASGARAGSRNARPSLILCLALATAGAVAAPSAAPVTITSSSKQITVRGLRTAHIKNEPLPQTTLVMLDPAILAVTAETIRQSLRQELGFEGSWQGRVFVEIHPIQRQNEEIVVRSVRSPEGWNYRIDTPDEVDPPRLMRAFVGVFLLEFANRATEERSVELPPWLIPGLAAHLQAGPLATAVLSPNRPVMRTRVQGDPVGPVRTLLQSTAPLTVNQLNWPDAQHWQGEEADLYRACAHLFVHQLLRLRGGGDCLREMLELLPQHLNWQTAFLRAFAPHFQRMLDVEKWWSLVMVDLTGRDTTQVWPLPESRQRLDELLYTPVKVRLERDEIPHESMVSLQTVLSEWDFAEQNSLLKDKLARLKPLQTHLAPPVAELAEDYGLVLGGYLRAREQDADAAGTIARMSPNARIIITDAMRDLKALDARREKLWNLPPAPPVRAGFAPPGSQPPRSAAMKAK